MMLLLAFVILFVALLLLLVWRHPWFRAKSCGLLYTWFGLSISQAQAAAHLQDIDDIFRECKLHFWLTEGTALGAIREGRVIPTDTDIDIGVREAHVLRACALPRLQERGFMVWRDKPHMVSVVRGFLYVDIMVFRPGEYCVDMPCDEMERFMPTRRRVDMYGLALWTMSEDYLVRTYGHDWRTPKHQWKPPSAATPRH